MTTKTDKYGKMGERREKMGGEWLAKRSRGAAWLWSGTRKCEQEGIKEKIQGGCRGEAESGRRSHGGTAASAAAAIQWGEDVQKVLECPVPAPWVQRELWWPGRTLPGCRPSRLAVLTASRATTA